jgi:hypothetical protein
VTLIDARPTDEITWRSLCVCDQRASSRRPRSSRALLNALADGMQSFTISVAKAINAIQGREGKVFAYRYHSTKLTSPRQTRHCIAYVLNNWRRHNEDVRSLRARAALLDEYASGVQFDGWRDHTHFAIPDWYDPLPVAAPRSWLLARGWREHHPLIRVDEVPGPLR